MNKDKQAKLEAAGWRVGSAEDFLRQPRARMGAYHVTYKRDEFGWWVASVREVRGCHAQGRTVDQARRRIRKVMELFVEDARSAKLVDNVKLRAEKRGSALAKI